MATAKPSWRRTSTCITVAPQLRRSLASLPELQSDPGAPNRFCVIFGVCPSQMIRENRHPAETRAITSCFKLPSPEVNMGGGGVFPGFFDACELAEWKLLLEEVNMPPAN